MRFFALLRFFSGAFEFSRLDLKNRPDAGDIAFHQKCHRRMVFWGKIGGGLGVIFGFLVALAMMLHPPHKPLGGDDIYVTIFLAMLMPIVGILTGASWVTDFFPAAFYRGPAGKP